MINDPRVTQYVCDRTGGHAHHMMMSIGKIRDDGQPYAGVVYDDFNGAVIRMHVAGERHWLTRGFLWLVFDYPFLQLRVHKVVGMVSSCNRPALDLDLRLGFVREARIEGGCEDGDLEILTMTREQCRWLNGIKG